MADKTFIPTFKPFDDTGYTSTFLLLEQYKRIERLMTSDKPYVMTVGFPNGATIRIEVSPEGLMVYHAVDSDDALECNLTQMMKKAPIPILSEPYDRSETGSLLSDKVPEVHLLEKDDEFRIDWAKLKDAQTDDRLKSMVELEHVNKGNTIFTVDRCWRAQNGLQFVAYSAEGDRVLNGVIATEFTVRIYNITNTNEAVASH